MDAAGDVVGVFGGSGFYRFLNDVEEVALDTPYGPPSARIRLGEIGGPRFSTRAESRWFSSAGWDVVNMTQYPEAWLARELELCYANVMLVTDYDVGLEDMPHVEAVSADIAFEVFRRNLDKLRALL